MAAKFLGQTTNVAGTTPANTKVAIELDSESELKHALLSDLLGGGSIPLPSTLTPLETVFENDDLLFIQKNATSVVSHINKQGLSDSYQNWPDSSVVFTGTLDFTRNIKYNDFIQAGNVTITYPSGPNDKILTNNIVLFTSDGVNTVTFDPAINFASAKGPLPNLEDGLQHLLVFRLFDDASLTVWVEESQSADSFGQLFEDNFGATPTPLSLTQNTPVGWVTAAPDITIDPTYLVFEANATADRIRFGNSGAGIYQITFDASIGNVIGGSDDRVGVALYHNDVRVTGAIATGSTNRSSGFPFNAGSSTFLTVAANDFIDIRFIGLEVGTIPYELVTSKLSLLRTGR